MFDADGSDQIVRDLTSIGWSGFERPLPDVFGKYVARLDGLVVDVGANTGFYSLLACVVRSDVFVSAFEPYPPALARLRVNLDLNGFADRVQVHEAALSESDGLAELFVPSSEHGLVETSCTLNSSFKDGFESTCPVRVSTLDSSVSPGQRVSIVKIDVESVEAQVLAGGARILERWRPVVFLEVLPSGDSTAIEDLRVRLDYVDVRLRPSEALMGARVQFDGDAWNHLLVPAERAGEAQTILRENELEIRMEREFS
jgi:FkbM family methyltransferase